MQQKNATKTQSKFSLSFCNNSKKKKTFQTTWGYLSWCKIENYVLRFQIEIYYASMCHDYLKMKWLQKQLIHTVQAKLIASRSALLYTKQREGSLFLRRGDGVICLSLALTLFLKNKKKKLFETAQSSFLKNKKRRIRFFDSSFWSKKNIFVKKKNYFLIKERAKHIIVKLAIEPEWEARFSPNCISLRTGRTLYDGFSTFLKNFDNSCYYVVDGYISHNLTVSVQSQFFHDLWFRKIDTFIRLKTEIKKWLDKKNCFP